MKPWWLIYLFSESHGAFALRCRPGEDWQREPWRLPFWSYTYADRQRTGRHIQVVLAWRAGDFLERVVQTDTIYVGNAAAFNRMTTRP